MKLFFFFVSLAVTLESTQSFGITSSPSSQLQRLSMPLTATRKNCEKENQSGLERRAIIARTIAAVGWVNLPVFTVATPAMASSDDVSALLKQVKEARAQLDAVPDLIKAEKWDSVRAILITPPLSDCWAKNAKPTLQKYAEAG